MATNPPAQVHGSPPPGPWTPAAGWSRSGGDERNSRCSAVRGAASGTIARRLSLPSSESEPPSSGLAGDAERVWLVHGRHAGPVGSDLRSSSLRSVGELIPASETPLRTTPLVLGDGTAVVVAAGSAAFLSPDGELRGRIELELDLDDSGISPTTTLDGRLVLSAPTGEVVAVGPGGAVQELGRFGYDSLPPARFADGSFAVTAFGAPGDLFAAWAAPSEAGAEAAGGFQRIGVNGEVVWSTGFAEVDLVPTINARGVAGASTQDLQESRIYSAVGALLGVHPEPGVFACLDDDWLLLSPVACSRLDPAGQLLWRLEFGAVLPLGWGGLGPIIDVAGRIFVPVPGGLACLESTGTVSWLLELGTTPTAIAPLADGVLAVVAGDELLAIE